MEKKIQNTAEESVQKKKLKFADNHFYKRMFLSLTLQYKFYVCTAYNRESFTATIMGSVGD